MRAPKNLKEAWLIICRPANELQRYARSEESALRIASEYEDAKIRKIPASGIKYLNPAWVEG